MIDDKFTTRMNIRHYDISSRFMWHILKGGYGHIAMYWAHSRLLDTNDMDGGDTDGLRNTLGPFK